jgi:formylglycine-generating enzyme required for sulfatase activity
MLIAGCALLSHPAKASSKELLLPSGNYLPFFSPKSSKDKRSSHDAVKKPVSVQSFWMDVYPVTNGDFLNFVKSNPDWRRSKVSRIFADDSYLKHWKSDLAVKSSKDLNRPVT